MLADLWTSGLVVINIFLDLFDLLRDKGRRILDSLISFLRCLIDQNRCLVANALPGEHLAQFAVRLDHLNCQDDNHEKSGDTEHLELPLDCVVELFLHLYLLLK